jgi:predicted transcriptional regulator
MNSITIYVDPATEARLRQIADETGRGIEDLAESAVSEEALRHFRHRADDPAAVLPHALFAGAHRKLQAAL